MGHMQDELIYTGKIKGYAEVVDYLMNTRGWSFEEAVKVMGIPEDQIEDVRYEYDDIHYEG